MLPLDTVPLQAHDFMKLWYLCCHLVPEQTCGSVDRSHVLLRQSEVKADALRTHELQVAYASELHKEYCTAVQPLIAEICRGEIKGSLAANEMQVS